MSDLKKKKLRIQVTAAVLSQTGTVAEIRDIFTRCEIAAEMTEEQCFKRNVNQHEEESDFCIISLIKVELFKEKLLSVTID